VRESRADDDAAHHALCRAPVPEAAQRPQERGLRVRGTLEAGATGVRVQIVDGGGNVMALRQTADSNDSLDAITGTMGSPGADLTEGEAKALAWLAEDLMSDPPELRKRVGASAFGTCCRACGKLDAAIRGDG
jgi:hypothetical protein